MKKKLCVMLMGLTMLATSITGCGSSDSSAPAMAMKADSYYETNDAAAEIAYDSYDYAEEEMMENADAGSLSALGAASSENKDSSASNLEYEDKLVYEANLTIETLDFDKTYGQLTALVNQYGGRIEEEQYDAHFGSYTSNKNYRDGYYTTKQDYLVIRIPSKNYNAFIAADGELGNVTGKTQTLTNITQNYYSTKTKIDLLQGQKEYYEHQLELIEEKLMDCEDYEYVIGQMVELEDRIIDVQNQINQCSNSVKTMDMQVTYSTVYLNLLEVKEYSDITSVVEEPDDTFANRLKENLKASAEGFLRFMEGLLTVIIFVGPYIVTAAIIVGIVVAIATSVDKANKKKKALKESKENKFVNDTVENKK